MSEESSDAPESALELEEDFRYLIQLLPEGWQEKARSLGALRRCRGVSDAESLLRVLLIHLAEGCSLRETSLRVRRGNIAQLSDVAIMDRLRLSGKWFRWMNTQLMNSLVRRAPQSVYGQQLKVKLVDATRVQEPGPTGSSWVLHYCVALSSLACEQVIVTDQKKGSGESFKRFQAQAGDLYLADRAYGVRPGIFHLREAGAEVLVRFALDNLPLQDAAGRRWDLLKRLRRLSSTQVGDWPVELAMDDQRLPGRVCAIKKSRQARLAAQKKLLNSVSNRAKIKESTWESCGYIFVFTTLALGALSATQALELYRGRWQIELVFKRLKSILSLGYLRKVDPESARSWLEGKLFVAMLIEALWAQAESFFPWGYPLQETPSTV